MTTKGTYYKLFVEKIKVFATVALLIILIIDALPVAARSLFPVQTANNALPNIQAATTHTYTSTADAYVDDLHGSTNYGKVSSLVVENASNRHIESDIRFSVTGISGTIQSARLRVYLTTNSESNGPVVYASNTSWTETGVTWNNRSARTSGVLDNKGAISKDTWVEYTVTSKVVGNGTYSFTLVGDTSDKIGFSSREGSHPPQLVITYASSTPTSVATITRTATRTPTLSSNPTRTATRTPTASPTSSSASPILVGAGDISSCSNNNDEATAKLLDGIAGTVFTAGDNAYDSGTYTEYINCYDPTWGRHKARTKPVPGNHEYQTSGAAGYFQYFNNVPAYYAYNLGAWRIYALNSEVDVSSTGTEATWLQADLAANPKLCVLAYWHKPRWSSGTTHGSNSGMQTLWQILYNAGAELVINGHEHNYERFTQMNASGSAVTQGLREIVVGTGGESHYPFGTPLSTSQVRNSSTFGVLKLTLNASSYSWQFVPVVGSTFTDSGTTNCR